MQLKKHVCLHNVPLRSFNKQTRSYHSYMLMYTCIHSFITATTTTATTTTAIATATTSTATTTVTTLTTIYSATIYYYYYYC